MVSTSLLLYTVTLFLHALTTISYITWLLLKQDKGGTSDDVWACKVDESALCLMIIAALMLRWTVVSLRWTAQFDLCAVTRTTDRWLFWPMVSSLGQQCPCYGSCRLAISDVPCASIPAELTAPFSHSCRHIIVTNHNIEILHLPFCYWQTETRLAVLINTDQKPATQKSISKEQYWRPCLREKQVRNDSENKSPVSELGQHWTQVWIELGSLS